MVKRFRIVLVGGGSVTWSPTILNDMMLKEGLGDAEYVLLDLNREAAERIAKFARLLARRRRLGCTFQATTNQKAALEGADSIIITVSTGGLDAMQHDIAIPESYSIYQTVGDTVGPGGWARGLRNIPVFIKLAQDIKAVAPDAWVLNYTNPMGTLTRTLTNVLDQPAVGLCHGVFEVFGAMKTIFKLESEDEIKVRFGGVNHFFWILDISIAGQDGYALLRERMKGRTFSQLMAEVHGDPPGHRPRYALASEFFSQVGYLPYGGDRHTAEFVSGYLNIDEARLADFNLIRTTVQERRDRMARQRKDVDDMIAGRKPLPKNVASRETAADISATKAVGLALRSAGLAKAGPSQLRRAAGEFIDVVNLPNRGQIANLPLGTVVESMGVVNGLGFTPLTVGNLPESALNLVLPHARNQALIVDAIFQADKEMAMQALLNDPLCSHLPKSKIRRMGEELWQAHRLLLPKPFGAAPAVKV